MDMTERPGRSALFSGAVPPAPVENTAKNEQAQKCEKDAEESKELIRQAQQTIAELRQRLDLMVSKNPVPMLITTPTFSITEANVAYIQMSGINENEIVNKNLKSFKIISQEGEGAKIALQEKRRAFGEVTVELPSGTRVLEQ